MNDTQVSQSVSTVTVIGQSKSGKTHLLSALLNSPNRYDELTRHEPALIEPSISEMSTASDEIADGFDQLTKHCATIVRGEDVENPGTNYVRYYPCNFVFRRPVDGGGKPKRLIRFSNQELSSDMERLPFELVDGRGGDLAPDASRAELEAEEGSERDEEVQKYRDAMVNSIALIICLPIASEEFDQEMFARFRREINRAIVTKKDSGMPPFQRIAICFTKYELLFSGYREDAWNAAIRPKTFTGRIKTHAALKLLQDLLTGQSLRPGSSRSRLSASSEVVGDRISIPITSAPVC